MSDEPRMQDLRTRAAELGIAAPVGIKKVDLAKAIADAETGRTAPGPAAPVARATRARAALTADERHELAQLRAERDRQQAKDITGVEVDLSDRDQAARAEYFADWPKRGGGMPQPWDQKALGLQNAVRDLIDQQPAGAPNTVSPIVIHHPHPTLTHGSSDPGVQQLGRILGALGFRNSVSDGQNPFGSVDSSVMGAVHAFRDAYGVEEDPTGFGGNTPKGRETAASHIGPWTWEAVLRAGQAAA